VLSGRPTTAGNPQWPTSRHVAAHARPSSASTMQALPRCPTAARLHRWRATAGRPDPLCSSSCAAGSPLLSAAWPREANPTTVPCRRTTLKRVECRRRPLFPFALFPSWHNHVQRPPPHPGGPLRPPESCRHLRRCSSPSLSELCLHRRFFPI
jgi:hypothetical protein